MGIIRNVYLKIASEKTLRRNSQKMQEKLDRLDYDSKRHTRIWRKNIDYVNAISSKCAGRLPKREHGWYISKDD